VRDAEAELLELSIRQSRAQWVQNTYITDDTELLAAEANEAYVGAATRLAAEAHRFEGLKLPGEQYGSALVPPSGPIPAHLLGNMWSQSWGNIAPLLGRPSGVPGYDLTAVPEGRKTDARAMVRYGEGFFTSLGFDTLPATFWTRSLLVNPRDREVLCHASAWDIDFQRDVRIKMCIEPTADEFATIHHELGHNYYQMAYRGQPLLFAQGAKTASTRRSAMPSPCR
jgi:hypothetical protein